MVCQKSAVTTFSRKDNMKVLITSGGTKIKIDKVRDITNMSTGTFGTKIAKEYLRLGHEVTFMRAKNSKSPARFTVDLAEGYEQGTLTKWYDEMVLLMPKYKEHIYTTYEQYAEMLRLLIGMEQPDIIVLAAAVSDYGIDNYFDGKLRSFDMLTLKLSQLPKIINKVKGWAPNAKLIGFKLLVDGRLPQLIEAAKKSLVENDCDMVVANDLQDIKDGKHRLQLVTKDNVEQYCTLPGEPDYLARMVVKHSFVL